MICCMLVNRSSFSTIIFCGKRIVTEGRSSRFIKFYLLSFEYLVDLYSLEEICVGKKSFHETLEVVLSSNGLLVNFITDLPKLSLFQADEYSFYKTQKLGISSVF